MGDAPATKSKLQVLLERPPQNWADAVIVAVVKDPVFYGGAALAVFLALSLVALWATRELIKSIDKDERKKKRAAAKQKKQQEQERAVATTSSGDKKTQ